MDIRTLNRGESGKAMTEWLASYPNPPKLDGEYAVLRSDLMKLFHAVLKNAEEKGIKIQDYYTDIHFGMLLYMYLKNQDWFSLRVAADDGFWRYLSLVVIPEAVATRWGKDNEDHYWRLQRRIWPKQLWWYIHLSWNTDEKTTMQILESANCSTDTILNLVERSGKKGTCIDAYRWIVYFYSIVPPKALSEYNKSRKKDDLFRVVMKLNTARMLVAEPALCVGGFKGYANKLFVDAGMDINTVVNQ